MADPVLATFENAKQDLRILYRCELTAGDRFDYDTAPFWTFVPGSQTADGMPRITSATRPLTEWVLKQFCVSIVKSHVEGALVIWEPPIPFTLAALSALPDDGEGLIARLADWIHTEVVKKPLELIAVQKKTSPSASPVLPATPTPASTAS